MATTTYQFVSSNHTIMTIANPTTTTWAGTTGGSFGSLTTAATNQWIFNDPVTLTEEVTQKLIDLIEQLDRLDKPKDMRAVAAGIAQEADCSVKEAKVTLIALRSLLSLAAIERKLEAV